MNGMVLLLALAAPGIDYGWRPGTDGQLEYIVQLEPELVEALRLGREVRSDIHPQARGMRRFIIRQGTGELPQYIGETSRVAQREPPLSAHYSQSAARYGGYGRSNSPYVVQSARIPDTSDELPEGVQTGWRSTDTGQLEYIIQLDATALETLKGGGQLIGDIDSEITSVSRLLVRFGNEPPPRVGVAMASGSDRLHTDGRGSVLRTQGETPVVMQGSVPTTRSATGSGQSSNQRSVYGSGNEAGTATSTTTSSGNSATRSGNSAASSAPRPDPRDPRQGQRPSSGGQSATSPNPSTSRTSPAWASGSPWTNAANAAANLIGSPASGGNTVAGGSAAASGPGNRPGSNPGLLQAPPTGGFTYSAGDDDQDDEWTIARGEDRGWQQQGVDLSSPHSSRDPSEYRVPSEYQDERYPRDWGPNDRSAAPPRDYRQPPQAGGSDPYADRYGRYDDSRSPRAGSYDDRRFLESERYASTAGPTSTDRVTRASAEGVSERELALERELAQERQKALERRLAEQERALASIAARPTRPRESIDEESSRPRTSNASRESLSDERPTPAARLGNSRSSRSEGGGELLKELILFASLGMNIVAVLIARQYYMRYRMLIREMRDPDSPLD